MTMNTKDAILIFFWSAIVLSSMTAVFYVYVLQKNYQYLTLTECDSEEMACFVVMCDKESPEYQQDICRTVADGEMRQFSYIFKKMKSTEQCDARAGECKPLVCTAGEEGCQIVSCNKSTLLRYAPEGTSCTEEPKPKIPEKKPEPTPQEQPIPNPIVPDEGGGDLPLPEGIPGEEVPLPLPVPNEEDLPEPSHNLPI